MGEPEAGSWMFYLDYILDLGILKFAAIAIVLPIGWTSDYRPHAAVRTGTLTPSLANVSLQRTTNRVHISITVVILHYCKCPFPSYVDSFQGFYSAGKTGRSAGPILAVTRSLAPPPHPFRGPRGAPLGFRLGPWTRGGYKWEAPAASGDARELDT